jgi:PAS domain S-box-containing protein
VQDELPDKTEQAKLIKQALAISEEKFKRVFENAPIGISLVDLNTRHVQVNTSLCQLLGYTAAELQGKTLHDFTHPQDLPKELPYLERIILGEIDSYNLEQRYLRKDGSSWWANLIVTVVRDDVGAILYTLGMVKDISDRKRSEQALFQSEERFRKIFESGPLGMAIIGFNQRIMKVNTMLCDMLDYDEASMSKLTLREITYPEDIEKDARQGKQLYYGKISQYQCEKRYIRKNGSLIWVLVSYSVMRDHNGKPINVLIAVRDITKQRQDQDFIKASLQEKEVLLKEIHHRVKNNLHVIANLLDLQAQNIEEEAIANLFVDSQNRIHAMALIHEQLYQSPTAGKISFNEYVENLTENLFQSYCFNVKQIEWQIEIEPVILNLETAIPCGLILNELVANSIKYAFPSCQSGQIYIRFKSISRDDNSANIRVGLGENLSENINHILDLPPVTTNQIGDRQYELIIGDNGVGIPAEINWQQTTSMGLRLVRILSRQLEAKVELKRANGTMFRFVFRELNYKERFKSYDGSQDSGG